MDSRKLRKWNHHPEIVARIINSGSLVNTGTIIGTEFDPNSTNNYGTLTFNVPNPAAEETLPEIPPNLPVNGEPTLPSIPNIEDLIDLDPGVPLVSNTGSGNTGGSNGPGSGPGTLGGNDQLYRDQMYVRGTVGYTATTNPSTTTTPPEMPGWNIDTSVIEQLLLAACLVSGGLALAYLSDTNMKSKIAKYLVDKLGVRKFNAKDVALFALDVVCFMVSPDLFSYVMIVYQTFAFMKLIDILTKSAQTGIMAIFSAVIMMLSLAVILKNIADNKLNSPLFNAIDWIEQFVKDFIRKMFGF